LPNHTPSWFAVVTKPRHERTVSAAFRAKDLQEFLPQYSARRRWSDRAKTVDLPLFPGYVFCRFGRADSYAVRQTPGVIEVVGFGGKPMPIEDHEIASLQTAVASGHSLQPWPFVRVGDRVRIDDGPLAGVSGVMIREKGAVRVVLSIELLQRSVVVEVPRDAVALLAS
jgi:transcription antitermination factor NusG